MGNLLDTNLVFWEIVTFLILTALLCFLVYPRVRNRIRHHQQPVEQPSTLPTTDRIERLRHALMWGGPRRRGFEPSRFGLWTLVAAWAFTLVLNVLQLFADRGDSSAELAQIVTASGIVGIAIGELLYRAGRRTLAALVWMPCVFALTPLGMTVIAVHSWSSGTAFGTALALFCSIVLPIWYVGILVRYLWTDDGAAGQGQ